METKKFKKNQLVSINPNNAHYYRSDREDGYYKVIKQDGDIVYISCIDTVINKEVEAYFFATEVSAEKRKYIPIKNRKQKENITNTINADECLHLGGLIKLPEGIALNVGKDLDLNDNNQLNISLNESEPIDKVKQKGTGVSWYIRKTYERIDIRNKEFYDVLKSYSECYLFLCDKGIIISTKKYPKNKPVKLAYHETTKRSSLNNSNLSKYFKLKFPEWKAPENNIIPLYPSFITFDGQKDCILLTVK